MQVGQSFDDAEAETHTGGGRSFLRFRADKGGLDSYEFIFGNSIAIVLNADDNLTRRIDFCIKRNLTTIFCICLLYTSPSPRDRG